MGAEQSSSDTDDDSDHVPSPPRAPPPVPTCGPRAGCDYMRQIHGRKCDVCSSNMCYKHMRIVWYEFAPGMIPQRGYVCRRCCSTPGSKPIVVRAVDAIDPVPSTEPLAIPVPVPVPLSHPDEPESSDAAAAALVQSE